MLRIYSKQSQTKRCNSCVYFLVVRNCLVSSCRLAATLKITSSYTSKCSLHLKIRKLKLRQWYPVNSRSLGNNLHSSDSRLHLFSSRLLPVSESYEFFGQLRIWTVSEGKAAGGKQKIPFITSVELRRFPGTFSMFIIGNMLRFHQAGTDIPAGTQKISHDQTFPSFFTPPFEMFCIFNNLIKKGLKLLFLPNSLRSFRGLKYDYNHEQFGFLIKSQLNHPPETPLTTTAAVVLLPPRATVSQSDFSNFLGEPLQVAARKTENIQEEISAA